jgi:hypothetical protein
MRKYLWIIAFLVFVPCAKADRYVVTSGFVSLSGDGGVITLSGVAPSGKAFTATGDILLLCSNEFPSGGPITPCGDLAATGDDLYIGNLTVTVNGASTKYLLGPGDDFPLEFNAAPMFLSGATQATLSEPIGGVVFLACNFAIEPTCETGPPFGPITSFVTEGSVEYTVNLVADSIGYFAPSQSLTITSPEPGTSVLLLAGVGLFGLVMRKRIAHGQQAN